jgi:hypothetical protein
MEYQEINEARRQIRAMLDEMWEFDESLEEWPDKDRTRALAVALFVLRWANGQSGITRVL